MQKKKKFQGIRDRFSLDHAFRVRMIGNNRDEEVCRRWDVLADEDHSYHLSEEEYFYYKNKWWLHLNKSGSDTLPLRKRSDFKQALSTLERLHQEAAKKNHSRPLLTGRTNNGSRHRVRLLHGGNGKTPGGLLKKFRKSRKRQAKSWGRTGRPFLTVLWRKPQKMAFKNSNCFVTV